MADMSIADSIKATGWGDRKENLFIDGFIRSSKVLSSMMLIDGVKSKAQIPIRGLSLTYGNNICNLKEGTGGEISLGEKEVTVDDFTYLLSNCKKELEGTYRSKLLKKGQNNEQSLDDDLKEWLFDTIAKKSGEKAVTLAASVLKTKMKADSKCISYTPTDGEDILATLQGMYEKFSSDMLDALMSESDKEFKPVIMMNSRMMQKYQLAIAEKDRISYSGLRDGVVVPYMGMDVVNFPSLADGEIIITEPQNLLLITDDYGDVKAIQSKFEPLEGGDIFFGAFKLGFDFRRSDTVVYCFPTTVAAKSGK